VLAPVVIDSINKTLQKSQILMWSSFRTVSVQASANKPFRANPLSYHKYSFGITKLVIPGIVAGRLTGFRSESNRHSLAFCRDLQLASGSLLPLAPGVPPMHSVGGATTGQFPKHGVTDIGIHPVTNELRFANRPPGERRLVSSVTQSFTSNSNSSLTISSASSRNTESSKS